MAEQHAWNSRASLALRQCNAKGNQRAAVPMSFLDRSMRPGGLPGLMRHFFLLVVALAALEGLPARAYVALMAGQPARPLNGTFNTVPVLHSNQPEEVEGPGILISTTPGVAYAAETGQPLGNAEFTFNGEFGVHLHHKYFPPYRGNIRAGQRRTALTIGLILINPGYQPVKIKFESGAVRNSFEAPYLGNAKIGVRPLGPRPWNTGPGDATAIQMLRGQLDRRLQDEVVIPPRSRLVLFSTEIPALGIANALLRGRSDGPFQMAVVAAGNPNSDAELLAVLDEGRLAPGRVYLSRTNDIKTRRIFSRVGGVALGDRYQASITHDLSTQGPLHVPFTSTHRHNFGTGEVQVNPLATRMLDSSLDNVGTYGVRFDVDLDLLGNGPYELVLSHPSPTGGKPFTAFRGSLQVRTAEGLQEMHVGMRSGQSIPLTTLNLKPGVPNPVRVSVVYPADATPGHLLSVVPGSQLARLREQERNLEVARAAAAKRPTSAPQLLPPIELQEALLPVTPDVLTPNLQQLPPPPPPPLSLQLTPVIAPPMRADQTLVDRYQQALEAQQQRMRGLMGN